MTSEAKHQANAANAQHSTGPVTAAGKAASSQNAITHGLTAQNIVPRTDDEKLEFEAIRNQAYSEFRPAGHTETLLADRIIHARCCQVRVTRLLGELETGTLDDVLDPEYAKPIARLNRYYTMHERSEHRALQTLKAEQTNRGLKEASLGLTGRAGLPPLADFAKIAKVLKAGAPRRTRDASDLSAQTRAQDPARNGSVPAARPLSQDLLAHRL